MPPWILYVLLDPIPTPASSTCPWMLYAPMDPILTLYVSLDPIAGAQAWLQRVMGGDRTGPPLLPWKKASNSGGKGAGANLYLLFSFALMTSLERER